MFWWGRGNLLCDKAFAKGGRMHCVGTVPCKWLTLIKLPSIIKLTRCLVTIDDLGISKAELTKSLLKWQIKTTSFQWRMGNE